MCDDFEDDNAERDILEKNWKKNVDDINKDGYRAGLDAGQEESLQDGFNTTFKLSSTLLYSVAEIRGLVSGKLSYNLMKPGTLSSEQEHLLQALLGDIVEYETELLKFSRQLYNQFVQKQVYSQTSGTENCKNTVNECLAKSDIDENVTDNPKANDDRLENTLTHRIENVSESLDKKLENTDDRITASSLPEAKINQFKRRLKSILMTGS